jgi:hypothetical protein
MSINGLRIGGQYQSPKPLSRREKIIGWLIVIPAAVVMFVAMVVTRPDRKCK